MNPMTPRIWVQGNWIDIQYIFPFTNYNTNLLDNIFIRHPGIGANTEAAFKLTSLEIIEVLKPVPKIETHVPILTLPVLGDLCGLSLAVTYPFLDDHICNWVFSGSKPTRHSLSSQVMPCMF